MIRRIRRAAGAMRVPLAGPLTAVSLLGAAGLADGAFSSDGPRFSPAIAEAAPAADVSRFRPAEATTSTATPLIRLTPDTPTPVGGGAGGTATSEAGTAATPGGTGGPGGATPGATDGSGGAGTPGDPGSGAAPGSGPGPGRGEPRRDATSAALGTAGVMPAGTSAPGTDAGVDADADLQTPHPLATTELGGFSDPPGSAGSADTAGAIRDAPFQRSVGPFGVAVDVDDPAAAALWRQRGSPRADQSWADRLAANRPRPWGWWGFYPIAGLLFAVAAWRVVAGIRSGDGA